jgi:hypothetical protein
LNERGQTVDVLVQDNHLRHCQYIIKMTNHACTYWLLGSILFNESKMQMDELNEKEERETIPYGTPKYLPLLYALQPYEGKVPLEISD